MPRNVEKVVQDQVGVLFLQYASAVAQLEHALERIKELEKEQDKPASEDK